VRKGREFLRFRDFVVERARPLSQGTARRQRLHCQPGPGYIKFSDSYVTKAGPQIKAIKAMLDALTSGATPAPTSPAAPLVLTVIDTSDIAADLAWTPQAGATGYRVWRTGGDGQFAAIADVVAPGFADSGLTPRSTYRWRISALTNGLEGPPSNEVEAVTRAAAACANPGSCPWGN
jgi:hypothetical protein